MRPPGLGRRGEIIAEVTQAVMSGDLSPADLVEITAAIAAATPAPAAGANTVSSAMAAFDKFAPPATAEAQDPAPAPEAGTATAAAVPAAPSADAATVPGCWHTITPPPPAPPVEPATETAVASAPQAEPEPEVAVVREQTFDLATGTLNVVDRPVVPAADTAAAEPHASEATAVHIASISCEGGAVSIFGKATVVTQGDAASVTGAKRAAEEDPEDQPDTKRPRHWPPDMPTTYGAAFPATYGAAPPATYGSHRATE
jgi:hypothetical protein